MKKIITILTSMIISISIYAQDANIYLSWQTYLLRGIFNEDDTKVSYFIQTQNGIAEITNEEQGKEVCQAATWTWPIINSSFNINFVFGSFLGLSTGLIHTNYGIKNSYLINFDTQTNVTDQFRTFIDQNKVLALGIPFVIQVGLVEPYNRLLYLYAGGSIYWNYFHAKKRFIGDEEFDKYIKFNSPEVDVFTFEYYLGIHYNSFGLEFGIMPNGFYKQDYVNSLESKPYAGIDNNIIFIKFKIIRGASKYLID